MLLQLKPLFMGEKDTLPLNVELDLSALTIGDTHPFPHPVAVEGEVRVSADVVSLRAKARYLYEGACDRCLRDIRCERVVPLEHILVTSLNNEDNGDFVLVDNYQLPLDSLVEADLILSLPSKVLCREDCRGLCPHCGKDLNEGLCGCKPKTVDPRLEALGQWNHS